MPLEQLIGLVIYTPDTEAALRVYRDQLGIPLEETTHGEIREHFEALMGQTHIALWKGPPRCVPVYRVKDVAATLTELEVKGARRVFGPMDLGDGKRLGAVSAPDGAEVRLIEFVL